MLSALVLTEAPAVVLLLPLLARALVLALRAELLTPAVAAVTKCVACDEALVFAMTVPAGKFVVAVPLGVAPAVETKTSFSVSGLCQNCGAHSMTTWY